MRMDNNFEKTDVQHYINYLEGIINKMASNSANCKNWLLAIIAGSMAMQPSLQDVVDKIWLSYPLVILFCLLDSFYLGCEKYFRDIMDEFVKKVRHNDDSYIESLYNFKDRSFLDDFMSVKAGFFSIATWPFYGTLFTLIMLIDKGFIRLI